MNVLNYKHWILIFVSTIGLISCTKKPLFILKYQNQSEPQEQQKPTQQNVEKPSPEKADSSKPLDLKSEPGTSAAPAEPQKTPPRTASPTALFSHVNDDKSTTTNDHLIIALPKSWIETNPGVQINTQCNYLRQPTNKTYGSSIEFNAKETTTLLIRNLLPKELLSVVQFAGNDSRIKCRFSILGINKNNEQTNINDLELEVKALSSLDNLDLVTPQGNQTDARPLQKRIIFSTKDLQSLQLRFPSKVERNLNIKLNCDLFSNFRYDQNGAPGENAEVASLLTGPISVERNDRMSPDEYESGRQSSSLHRCRFYARWENDNSEDIHQAVSPKFWIQLPVLQPVVKISWSALSLNQFNKFDSRTVVDIEITNPSRQSMVFMVPSIENTEFLGYPVFYSDTARLSITSQPFSGKLYLSGYSSDRVVEIFNEGPSVSKLFELPAGKSAHFNFGIREINSACEFSTYDSSVGDQSTNPYWVVAVTRRMIGFRHRMSKPFSIYQIKNWLSRDLALRPENQIQVATFSDGLNDAHQAGGWLPINAWAQHVGSYYDHPPIQDTLDALNWFCEQ